MDPSIYKALLAAIDHQTPASSVMTLVGALKKTKEFDLLAPCGSKGETFLEEWIRSSREDSLPTDKHLEELALDCPELWNLKPPRKSLLSCLLETYNDRSFSTNKDIFDPLISLAIEHSSVEILGSMRVRLHDQKIPLLSHLLRTELSKSALTLARKGFRLDATLGDSVIVNNISTIELWNCFLEQGGDPLQKTDSPSGPKVIWEYLYENTRNHCSTQDLAQKILGWVENHHPHQVEDFKMKEYWSALDRYDAPAHFKSRSDWPTLQNSEGLTPMMLLLAKNGNHIKLFRTVKKALEGVFLRDKEGKNIWAYALASEHPLPPEGVSWLIENKVPVVKDHRQRGLLAQVILKFKNQHKAFPDSADKFAPYIAPDLESFWGERKSQEIVVSWLKKDLYWSSANLSRAPKFILSLAQKTPDEFLQKMHPELLGFLALFSLVENPECFRSSALNQQPFPEKLIQYGAFLSSADLDDVQKKRNEANKSSMYRQRYEGAAEESIRELRMFFEKNILSQNCTLPPSSLSHSMKRRRI